MSIHLLNNFIHKSVFAVALFTLFLASFSVVRAEAVYQAPSLITRMSESLGSANNSGMVLEAFETKVPVFPLGYVYPIEQLGGCNNAQECYVYCENPNNISVCATVSAQQGYMNNLQARKAIKFGQMISAGYLPNCNTMNDCEMICDNVNVQNECRTLMAEIDNSATVLGAKTNTDNFLGRSIFETCDAFDNCSGLDNSTLLGSTFNNLSQTGQLPQNCYDGQQCFQYCMQNTTAVGCNKFISAVGGINGDAENLFRASNLSSGGLSYEELLNGSNMGNAEYGSGGGITGGGGTLYQQPPQVNVNDIQSCIYKNQQGIDEETITPQQYNNVNEQNALCQKQFTPQVNAGQIAQEGQQKAVTGINSISQCLISSTNIATDISLCLSLGAN